MKQTTNSQNPFFLSFENGIEESQEEVITQLTASHRMFLDKMLPEIEQHFLILMQGNNTGKLLDILHCFSAFAEFREKLTDHIFLEEKLVFPFFVRRGEQSQRESVRHFIENHEDYETQLKHLVSNIADQLRDLHMEMSFRMLIHKLNSFNHAFESHGKLEDDLFLKFS